MIVEGGKAPTVSPTEMQLRRRPHCVMITVREPRKSGQSTKPYYRETAASGSASSKGAPSRVLLNVSTCESRNAPSKNTSLSGRSSPIVSFILIDFMFSAAAVGGRSFAAEGGEAGRVAGGARGGVLLSPTRDSDSCDRLAAVLSPALSAAEASAGTARPTGGGSDDQEPTEPTVKRECGGLLLSRLSSAAAAASPGVLDGGIKEKTAAVKSNSTFIHHLKASRLLDKKDNNHTARRRTRHGLASTRSKKFFAGQSVH